MTTREAIVYFGGIKAFCRKLDIMPQAVYAWGERPPKARQYEVEVLSGGELKVDESLLPIGHNVEA